MGNSTSTASYTIHDRKGYGNISNPRGATLYHSWETRWYLLTRAGYLVILPNDRDELRELAEDYKGATALDKFLEDVYATGHEPFHVFANLEHKSPHDTRLENL